MRNRLLACALMSTAIAALVCGPAFAVKKTSYPQVKVNIAKAFQPDDAFMAMRTALTTAIANKNAAALFALVGPSFVWTVDGKLSSDFNPGASAIDNFKVVFGFRAAGATTDGGVDDGPFWDGLAAFAADGTFYQDPDIANLVCSPIFAEASDEDTFDQADKKVESPDDATTWYFTLAETVVTSSPDARASTITKVGTVALPLLSIHPAQEGKAPPPPTHLEVLLPSGKSGWIPYAAARPMVSNRLCYAKTAAGKWVIVLLDEVGDQ